MDLTQGGTAVILIVKPNMDKLLRASDLPRFQPESQLLWRAGQSQYQQHESIVICPYSFESHAASFLGWQFGKRRSADVSLPSFARNVRVFTWGDPRSNMMINWTCCAHQSRRLHKRNDIGFIDLNNLCVFTVSSISSTPIV